ncbi:ROK family protein [Nonomuraea diastatica]|uniref:ROK family protein n=1 Tax=Nonomuraea diastatica TaxID=1848329 RepID=A0A4R4WD88_9ACTN|nr:ROK family protein [Nonomuraea diastatica]TDD14203.1 ROK family protein [Nonomuraea diastatica]
MRLGVDIGGTKIAAGLVTPEGTVRRRADAPTPAVRGPRAVVRTVVRLARELGLDGVTCAGVGTAGVADPAGREIVGATDAIRNWAGTPLAASLEAELDLPVLVRNDVHAFLAGELAGSPWRTALGVTVGTGIGGALALDGHVVTGVRGAAGHVGHVPVPEAAGLACSCGAEGHVEAVASGPAMTAAFTGPLPDDPDLRRDQDPDTRPDLRRVVGAAGDGDAGAAGVLARGGRALGRALAGVVNVWDPDVVILGGGVLAAGELYMAPLRAALAAGVLPVLADVPVVTARLGDDAVLVGAASAAGEAERARR